MALAATAMLVVIAPQGSMAQPKPKPAPKAAAPAPAPAPAPAQQQAPQQPQAELQLIYGPWVKFCGADPGDQKRICATVKDGREESGRLAIAVAIFEKDGDPHKLLRLTMPYGVVLQPGTRLIIDQDAPQTAPYVTCLPPETQQGGCIADYEATPELIAKLKKGQRIVAQAIHANSGPMSPVLDLKDFAKVYDGPPTDPKQIAETQTKLRDELQKRADEARKKLEGQQPATGAAAR